MSLSTVVRVIAECDRCGRIANVDGVQAQWESPVTAISDLCGPVLGWIADQGTQLCASCVAVAVCQSHGHEWGPWRRLPKVLEPQPCDDVMIRVCACCGRDQVTDVDEPGRRPA